jgi:ElaA protein
MKFKLKSFKELGNTELYAALALRAEVFVVEQKCAYQDLDGKDEDALHLLGYDGKDLVAYARLIKPGISYKDAAIGRVVVSPHHRGKKLGVELMQEAIKVTLREYKSKEIVVSAQKYLEKFYNDLGFVTESDVYLEDDIPHIKMRYGGKGIMK